MKISYRWIKEYIDVKKPPEEIADILTKSGSEVKSIDRLGSDSIMEVEITPNRSDCLSYIGIAREFSASTGKKIKMPPLKVGTKTSGKAPFTVEILDKDLCLRYTARLIEDVRVGESAGWLKEKIVSMGLRPVNNVVDLTNYILFELGQPMHAFDYDKIRGRAIVIRRAREGERIISIDNVERRLDKDMLVIADQKRPIAIGGVMGGAETEVTEATRNILLESAYFDPVSVRRTSFKLALMSESSYRFERGVDPGMVVAASDRAALLIKGVCGGKIAEFVDKGRRPERDGIVLLHMERLNQILNLNLTEILVKKILSSLGLKATSQSDRKKKGMLRVSIPSFRQDIKYEIDLIEEAARIYGYEKIALTIPRIVPNPERKSLSWKAKEKSAAILNALGLSEVITYGLVKKEDIVKVFGDTSNTISVKNPLSAEEAMMRPSLVPGALGVLGYNMNRGMKDLKIFEIGKVYYKTTKSEYCEKTKLCVAVTGLFASDWQRPKSNVTFFDLKGILEILFTGLGLKEFTSVENSSSYLAKEASFDIISDGKRAGIAGLLDEQIQDVFDLSQQVYIAELDLERLEPYINFTKYFTEIPKFPSVKRDISLIAGDNVSFENIVSLAKEKGGELVGRIELFDRYSGEQIATGCQGLSFRIEYRDIKKTLTAEDVDKVHNAIRKALVENLGIVLR